jgi:hypothetical protein
LPAKLIAGVVYAAPGGRTFCPDIPRPEPVIVLGHVIVKVDRV